MFNAYDGTMGFSFTGSTLSTFNTIATGQNSLNWNNIINQGFGIGSQIISAFGRNPSTQIAYNQSQGIFAVQPAGQPVTYQQSNPYANMSPQQIQAYQQSLGGGVGSGIDSALSWATQNPLIVFGAIAGAFLLFREPPRRR